MRKFDLERSKFIGPLVYTIWVKEFPLYVGVSEVSLARAFNHPFTLNATRIEVRYFKFIESAKLYEELLIKQLKPPYNITHNRELTEPKSCKLCRKLITSGRIDKQFCCEAHKKRYQRLQNAYPKIIDLIEEGKF
jgi:hypothetical protein